MSELALSEKRAFASALPGEMVELRISLSGPQVGSWAIDHLNDDLTPFGFFITSGGPEFTVGVVGRRSYGPAMLAGRLELGLAVDRSAFANSFEAVQVAIERLAQLPDAEYLAHASLSVQVERRDWRDW